MEGKCSIDDDRFAPDRSQDADLLLPPSSDRDWTLMLSSSCMFSPDVFEHIMLNLIKNPNIMSSHLFRADILYDSNTDASTLSTGEIKGFSSTFVQHMKLEFRPLTLSLDNFQWQRTMVRNLVPRNRQLDKDMVQTCHMYTKRDSETSSTTSAVVYVPHVQISEQMPWYHPCVQAVAFTYVNTASDDKPARIAIHLQPFASSPVAELRPRIDRTCLKLLQTIHRHGKGRMNGYEKRVHHDQVIPQQAFQDTYARLKQKYARQLIGDWVEQTDPTKHVFEDLGIAAFLIELWRDMYGVVPVDDREVMRTTEGAMTNGSGKTEHQNGISDSTTLEEGKTGHGKTMPEFVDIGCGNGVLVQILLSEGYKGSGFDVRQRKTWSQFASTTREHLQEMVLVPTVLSPTNQKASDDDRPEATQLPATSTFHSGLFKPGTFIVSNHADELTAWTPLLAYLNNSPFIAIPCCSHDLSGARFRAPELTRRQRDLRDAQKSQRNQPVPATGHQNGDDGTEDDSVVLEDSKRKSQAAETGTLKAKESAPGKGSSKKQMPSAYATLCSYVTALAEEIGFEKPEREMLRIPSTRNACIVGRKFVEVDSDFDQRQREQKVSELVQFEMNMPLEEIGSKWVERARSIAGKKGEGH